MKIYSLVQKYILPKLHDTAIWNYFKKTELYRYLLSRYLIRLNDEQHIYPIQLPEIKFQEGLDLLLLEIPCRYQPMVPNGMGYLELILEKTKAEFQIFDANILLYHRFHSDRLLNHKKLLYHKREITDPWETDASFLWKSPEMLSFFQDFWEEILTEIEKAKPRMIGFSVHENNRMICNYLVKEIRKRLPQTQILAGGYDCYHPELGRVLFPDFDYMFIGEAEMNLPVFIERFLADQPITGIPGILLKDPATDKDFKRVELLQDLDSIGYPQYHFCKDFSIYRTYNGIYTMFPISGSRGCVWARCNFCAECIKFRFRDPKLVFEEIQKFSRKGFNLFTFNESDCNGKPENLAEICDLIIQSGIKVYLTGQLRIHPRSDRAYFDKLKKAGFAYLRFGVDGFCDDILKLEQKGYNMKMVEANLKACRESGMTVDVNIVIGVPGKTDEMIEESCININRLHQYIDTICSLNTLMLNAGSKYYNTPELFGIKFRENKEEIYKKNPLLIPTELWYSENPYIDQNIRIKRLERIIKQCRHDNLHIGDFARKMVKIHEGENELNA